MGNGVACYVRDCEVAYSMTANPKKMRIKLPPKEYAKLRHRIYLKQSCCCIKCGRWLPFDYFSLHHIISVGAGGDDSYENCEGCCVVGCHPD